MPQVSNLVAFTATVSLYIAARDRKCPYLLYMSFGQANELNQSDMITRHISFLMLIALLFLVISCDSNDAPFETDEILVINELPEPAYVMLVAEVRFGLIDLAPFVTASPDNPAILNTGDSLVVRTNTLDRYKAGSGVYAVVYMERACSFESQTTNETELTYCLENVTMRTAESLRRSNAVIRLNVSVVPLDRIP